MKGLFTLAFLAVLWYGIQLGIEDAKKRAFEEGYKKGLYTAVIKASSTED